MACPVPPSVTAPPRNAALASLLRSIIQPPGCLALRVLGFRTSLWPQPLIKVRTPSPPPPYSIQLLHPRLTVRDGLPLLSPIPTTTRPHGIFVTNGDHQCHPTMTRSVQGVLLSPARHRTSVTNYFPAAIPMLMVRTPTKQRIETPPYITVFINATVIMTFLLYWNIYNSYSPQVMSRIVCAEST